MTGFATTTTAISLAILAGFVALSVYRFGWRLSYSRYAAKWMEFLYIDNHTHTWSIVTMVVAILLAFGTIEAGDESPLQFLGFFAPVYLGIVALTPEYESDDRKGQKIVHYVGTALCAACTILWLIFTLRCWFYIPIAVVLCGVAAYFTKTYKKSYILWAEISLFAAVYGAVVIGG